MMKLFCRVLRLLLVLGMLLPGLAFGFEFVGKIETAKRNGADLDFKLSNAILRVTVLDEGVIRFRYARREFSKAPSYAVESPDFTGISDFTFNRTDRAFEIRTGEVAVEITRNPCRVAVRDLEGNSLIEDEPAFGVSFDGEEVRCFKKLCPEEQFFGLGEKARAVKRNGEEFEMWNSDQPFYSIIEDPLYVSIPFFVGVKNRKAYGLFFDNTFRSRFNMGAASRRFFWFGADKGEMDYYFFNGPSLKKIIQSYARLTGKMPLPPKWALGLQQSKWSYYPESEVRSVTRSYRERDIPCDTLYLDIDYMDGYRVFTWNEERFPDPRKMIRDLGKEGFKVIPIVDPGVAGIPLYLREGGFLPMQESQNYVGEKPLVELQVALLPKAKGAAAFDLYQDEDDGFGYQNNVFSLTRLACDSGDGLKLTVRKTAGDFTPPQKYYQFKIYGHEGAGKVDLDGKPLPEIKADDAGFPTGFWKNEKEKALMVRVPAGEIEVEIR